MSKAMERCERTILFSVLVGVYSLSQIFFIRDCAVGAARVPYWILTASSFLSVGYAILCLCYRGYVENMPDVFNSLAGNYPRACSICMRFKPERAHHCSRCRHCIRKMDHHCHWLGRCINYDNMGHFARFLFFTVLSTGIIFSFGVYRLVDVLFLTTPQITTFEAAVILMSILLSGFVGCITGIHLYSLAFLIANNMTYIEYIQRSPQGKGGKNYNSVYDIGFYRNVVDVLGSPAYLFLWKPSGDGLNFEKRFHEDLHLIEDPDSDLFGDI